MNHFQINFRDRWETVEVFQIIRSESKGFYVRFAKPRLGAVQPIAPLVRWNGQEAISANWSCWAPEASGMVEVVFTLP